MPEPINEYDKYYADHQDNTEVDIEHFVEDIEPIIVLDDKIIEVKLEEPEPIISQSLDETTKIKLEEPVKIKLTQEAPISTTPQPAKYDLPKLEINLSEPVEEIPTFLNKDSLQGHVIDALESAGLNQNNIAERILTCENPEAEVKAIMNEAHSVINTAATGDNNIRLKSDFEQNMSDLINDMNAKKKFKANCAKIGESIGDFILSTPDLICGTYQEILNKSTTARKAGTWLAKTFNHTQNKDNLKSGVSTLDRLRQQGKEIRRR